ncbi:MAG: hypothetical protein NT007_18035 [Candidatus Kapabacteria bacterium]|nr:hypothetical protein [Candidatus Kapabacteria bacterium]
MFADDASEKKEVTVDFFENYLNDFDVYISDIVLREIGNTTNPEKLNKLFRAIEHYKIRVFGHLNLNINSLSVLYLSNGIVP